MVNDTSHFLFPTVGWLMLSSLFLYCICKCIIIFIHMYVLGHSLSLLDVSARTAWTSWWAQEPLTSWKTSIRGAATCAIRHSVTETSNSGQTGALRFKTSLSTTAPWSLYVPHFLTSLYISRLQVGLFEGKFIHLHIQFQFSLLSYNRVKTWRQHTDLNNNLMSIANGPWDFSI